jgi:hypothetical protein
MPEKNNPRIPFDDRSLPRNSLSKEKMAELETRLAPYMEEIKPNLKEELENKSKVGGNT